MLVRAHSRFAGSARDKPQRTEEALHKLQLVRIEPTGQLWFGSVTAAAAGSVRPEQVSLDGVGLRLRGVSILTAYCFCFSVLPTLPTVHSAISGAGGGGRDQLYRAPEMKRQIRYRQCYFNPISCFKK